MAKITIDVSEDQDLSMKDVGISMGDSGLLDVVVSFGQLEVIMSWEQVAALHDVLNDWMKPDDGLTKDQL